MNFANQPILVVMALTLPLLTVFLVWAWRKKQKLVAQFVQSRLLAALTVGVSPARQKVRIALLVGAVASLFLALAQPQWGFAWEEAKQRGLDIVVAIDTSRSMLAQDVPPNRLTRAKLAALDLMKVAKTDRLGLVAFAGTAFLQCPLTLDDEAFRQSVGALDVGVIPQGGTALTESIQTALSAFKDEGENFKVLVLFTDGEDHEEGAVQAAEKAAKAGLKIFTIGVGTGEGELLRQTDEKGVTSFIKDDAGKPVKSQLNEKLLRQIAEAANGFYLPLRGANVIESLYKQGLAPLPKSDIATKRMKHLHERFQWPLGFAILLLCVELFLPERKRVQRTAEIAAAPNAELRNAVALLLLVALPALAFGSPSTARRQYESGRYDDALFEYQRLLEKKPDDDRLRFNAGAAAYKAKEFEAATKNFEAALQSRDIGLQQRSYYNLGNTLYQQGEAAAEPQQKSGAWEQAVKSFESALKLNSQDTDARHNLDFVKKRLEELKQQQKKQKKDKSQDDSDKDKDDQQSDSPQKDQQQDKNKQSEQQKSDEQKKQEQQQQQEQQKSEQAKKDEEKKDQEKQSAQSNDEKKDDEQSSEESQMAQAQPGQMTKQQAQQLLDAQKGDEKVMMFLPQEMAKRKSQGFKDW
ncbi:MAG: VWA domain-containing protein [Verrucomicrobia bacterium]|nr:VWA domain-containing protein [Verrucomicrobiota bacterium]